MAAATKVSPTGNTLGTEHLTPETLVDYFDQRLSEREQAEIERHIADCLKCTTLARQVRQLSAVWDRWTAHSHAAALKARATNGQARKRHAAKPRRKA